MKIPFKVTKATRTRLNKQNLAYLNGEINGQHHDLLIEADILREWDPLVMVQEANSMKHKETVLEWHSEIKLAFKDFRITRTKIEKAYYRYLGSKK